uniref:Uncharacterized protein n=1 Tax=Oryza sativa subsp. japonica TaxID=39947 RepID=Q2R1Y8_ORYSJ|nr:hypothetical protein LOC_Os11g37620 [Oryza sativa Japonica Group]
MENSANPNITNIAIFSFRALHISYFHHLPCFKGAASTSSLAALPHLKELQMLHHLKELAAVAGIHMILIYLCRFLLRRSRNVLFTVSNSLRFRLKVLTVLLYICLSVMLFYLFGSIMPLPPWGLVVGWVMALIAVELAYAFIFPYSFRYIADNDDDKMVILPV